MVRAGMRRAGSSSGGGGGGAFDGLTGIDTPLEGNGTVANHLRIPAATGASAGHMTAAQVAALTDTAAIAATALQTVSVTAPIAGAGTAGSPLSLPAATNAAAGHMSAGHVSALEALAAGQGLGWVSRYIADAVTKAGISDSTLQYIDQKAGFLTFGSGGTNYDWEAVVVSGGAIDHGVTLSSERGGYWRATRSTTTGTVHYQRRVGSFFEGNGGAGRRWYMRGRVQLQGIIGMGASAIIAFGASNSGAHANFIDVGVVAANSTAKFSARITGTTTVNLISTVNLDTTAWHDVILWCDGTNTFLSVDSEAAVSGAYVAFTNPLRPNIAYIADGTAGTRELYGQRMLWAVEEDADL